MHIETIEDHCRTAQDVIATARRVRENRRKLFGQAQRRAIVEIPRPMIVKEPEKFTGIIYAHFQEMPVFVEKLDGAMPLNRIEILIKAICLYSKISKAEIISHRRHGSLIRARHITMILARVLFLYSFPEIGHRLGGRDHSTVIHAFRKCEILVRDLEKLKEMPLNELIPYAFAQYDALKSNFLRRSEKYAVSKSGE
ncbi:MAG: hypothetical protein KGL39_20225 [Patescibacteria group bacterium]|nr:hypothetical protein [Patescibacteria group bacterium]